MKKLCSIKPAGKTARGGSKASGTLGERPLLPLATFHLAFDQVQPLLLDVLPGENQAMVFVSKIKGICGREQEQMGLVGLGGHLHHICLQGEPPSLGGLVASPAQALSTRFSILSIPWQCHPHPSGSSLSLVGLPVKVWSCEMVATAPSVNKEVVSC